MPIQDEELPKKKAHEIGEDLAALSLDELDERIALLKGEIARIEEAIKSKQASAAGGRLVLQAIDMAKINVTDFCLRRVGG